MIRRKFLIVDDMPILGNKLNNAIEKYYAGKNIRDVNTKLLIDSTQFNDASEYIKYSVTDIDIIFSDQNLMGGKGMELFKASRQVITTLYPGVIFITKPYRVLHSDEDRRLKEQQKNFRIHYEYFINSEIENKPGNEVTQFLDFYENDIAAVKVNGNKTYIQYLYQKTLLQSFSKLKLNFGGMQIALRDIIFFLMDKDDTKSEYYHCFYYDRESVMRSKKSMKLSSYKDVEKFEFFTGNLSDGHEERVKINPLWVSGIEKGNSLIKFISPNSIFPHVKFSKLSHNESLLYTQIDPFFL